MLWEKNYKVNWIRLFKVLGYELKTKFSRFPYIAEIDVTSRCNLKCNFCFYFKNPDLIPAKELTIEEWEHHFQEIYKRGIRRLCLVGGEPSLRIDVLKLANKTFPYIDICSNGLIKIPEDINHRIFISVDGRDEYNQIYRGKEILQKISENYCNDKRVILLMTLNSKNYNDIDFIAQYAEKNRFKSLVFSLYTPLNREEELYIDDSQRFIILQAIEEAKKKYPQLIKMNKFSIKWYATKNHKNKCYWRDKVMHYNSLMQERNACLNMDCTHCGYFSGANIAPMNTFY